MRPPRWLRVLLSLLLAVGLAAAGGAAYLVRRPFPQIAGTLPVKGLQAPVEVIRDRWGIPHIYARNAHDLFFAQGYVHAQDRLWQMELFRRIMSGRISEFAGESALDTDRFMRVLGLRRAAETAWSRTSGEAAGALLAYSEGVNAFIETHRSRLPLEFLILRIQPEPWSPVDTLGFAKFMSWVLSATWRSELLRAGLTIRFGPDALRMFLPPQAPGSPVISAGRDGGPHARAPLNRPNLGARGDAAASGLTAPSGLPFAAGLMGFAPWGSNNWVIGPQRSASGATLLANDAHLEAQMPAIWYENHLVGGGFNVVGASFAGVPGVILGHNEHIAWGATNGNPDVQDLYIERFHPRNPTLYLYKGQWVGAKVVLEEIKVKGRADPELVTVRITRHGPVLNAAVRGLGAFYALRWSALDPDDPTVNAILGLNRASSWDEFRSALRDWAAAPQNFVYADRRGNIGYLLPGRIPIRPAGSLGLLPMQGWAGDQEWQGYIPAKELPAEFNPQRRYAVTANNRIAPAGFPHHLGSDYDVGFRALRITSLLTERPKHTLDDFARMQNDLTSLLAQRLIAAWQHVKIQDGDLASLFQELQRWNGRIEPDSRPALIYEAVQLKLLRALFRDSLDAELFMRYLRRFEEPLLVLVELSGRPDDPWWGDAGRDRVIEEALRDVTEDLAERLGADRSGWTWGRVHRLVFQHAVGRVRGLGWIFNAASPPTGGDAMTLNMGAYDPVEPFTQVAVASYRQLIDTGDWTARTIHTTGQSGLPFHRHYRDFVNVWARGEYHPLLFDRQAIEQTQEGTLELVPPR